MYLPNPPRKITSVKLAGQAGQIKKSNKIPKTQKYLSQAKKYISVKSWLEVQIFNLKAKIPNRL